MNNGKISSLGMSSLSRREIFYYAWFGAAAILLLSLPLLLTSSLQSNTRRMWTKKWGDGWGHVSVRFAYDMIETTEQMPYHFQGLPDGTGFYIVRSKDDLYALQDFLTSPRCILQWQPATRTFRCPIDGSEFREDGAFVQGQQDHGLYKFVIEAYDKDGKVIQNNLGNKSGQIIVRNDETHFNIASIRVYPSQALLREPSFCQSVRC